MSIENNLSEIRQALSNLSAVHASGQLTRADMIAAVLLVETNCDEIEAANATSPAAPFGISTLPVLTLKQVAAEARADGQRAVGRSHLRVVPTDGDAA